MRSRVSLALGTVAVAAILAFPAVASASHDWDGYHWARTSNPFTLKLGDNVSGLWDGMLGTASTDWTQSTVLNTTVVAGGTKPKSCRPTTGRVEVCSARYGNNGWLGLAQIWISGKHITQGLVKNNDYYFGSSSYRYNNTAEMQHVICQEIGHTLGLDHQSEDGSSQDTCMDYYHNTSATDTKSTSPNSHDYAELSTIYSHLDSTTTVLSSATRGGGAAAATPGEWGRLVASSNGGLAQTFAQDLGAGRTLVTFVIWAEA
jgi:hypothetical protein